MVKPNTRHMYSHSSVRPVSGFCTGNENRWYESGCRPCARNASDSSKMEPNTQPCTLWTRSSGVGKREEILSSGWMASFTPTLGLMHTRTLPSGLEATTSGRTLRWGSTAPGTETSAQTSRAMCCFPRRWTSLYTGSTSCGRTFW